MNAPLESNVTSGTFQVKLHFLTTINGDNVHVQVRAGILESLIIQWFNSNEIIRRKDGIVVVDGESIFDTVQLNGESSHLSKSVNGPIQMRATST